MAIKVWVEDGKVHFSVNVKARAKGNREIQRQRQEKGILKDLAPDQIGEKLPDDVRKRLQRIEIRLYGDAREEIARIEGAGISWDRLISRYEEEVANDFDILETLNMSERTARSYVIALRDHTEEWFKKPASQIDAADFEYMVLAMKKTGYANSTIYNLKSAINSCYKWGIKKRIIPNVSVTPTFGFTISRKNSRRPEILNFTQICTLLEKARDLNHAWYAIWKVVLYTGLRSGEAYALKVRDLDREEKRMFIDTKYSFSGKAYEELKDHEWRQVSINPELDQFFDEIGVWGRDPDEFVLPRVTAWRNGEAASILRAFCEQIGVTSICFHTLRACWATQLLRNGVAQSKVMIMGGWADLESMQVYLRRAGVEIEGATDSLKFERRERPARVLKLVSQHNNEAVNTDYDSE